jgi:hypothetical protein
MALFHMAKSSFHAVQRRSPACGRCVPQFSKIGFCHMKNSAKCLIYM